MPVTVRNASHEDQLQHCKLCVVLLAVPAFCSCLRRACGKYQRHPAPAAATVSVRSTSSHKDLLHQEAAGLCLRM
ncbi:hypothetical protein V8C26DRAFT_402084 [Trichoderma gracile]